MGKRQTDVYVRLALSPFIWCRHAWNEYVPRSQLPMVPVDLLRSERYFSSLPSWHRCAKVNSRSCESALSVQIESFSPCSIPLKVCACPSRLFAWLAFFILLSLSLSLVILSKSNEMKIGEGEKRREERRACVAVSIIAAAQWWTESNDDMLKR